MIKENRDKIISNLTILSNWNLSCCIRQGGTNSVMADDNYHSQLTNSNIPNWLIDDDLLCTFFRSDSKWHFLWFRLCDWYNPIFGYYHPLRQ